MPTAAAGQRFDRRGKLAMFPRQLGKRFIAAMPRVHVDNDNVGVGAGANADVRFRPTVPPMIELDFVPARVLRPVLRRRVLARAVAADPTARAAAVPHEVQREHAPTAARVD
ncbi:MAG: hypothetical protein L6R00_21495 [Phycisphaerae bacterium]|nr:hypothetical protein [Phycisphaerae bacterium]